MKEVVSGAAGDVRTDEAITAFRDVVAVVTGAGSGIGRALVKDLARRGARAVIAADVNAQSAKQTARSVNEETEETVVATVLDVTDEGAVEALVDDVTRDFGAIDFWFSNAGVNRGTGLGDDGDWRAALDINLLAHVYCARHALPAMEQRRTGNFVVTASAAGLLSDIRSAPYTVSKHALVGLAEWLAISAGEGVRVSCVCPEGVLTGMTKADSTSAGPGIHFMEADAVAGLILAGVARGDFLVLTHARTGEYEARRVLDRRSWINSMRKARVRSLGVTSLFAD